jgi:hypothetical protein
MAETAFQIQYRNEHIATFEQRASLLRDAVTTEAVMNGNQATFLVAGSGGATAVTRGVNGLIPSSAPDNTQTVATLTEWHHKERQTSFNIFASQGNQRAIMQANTVAVINRKVDDEILTELNTGTVNTGTTATASLSMALRAKTILGNAKVPWDGNIWAVVSPAFEAYLLQVSEFANANYVANKPIESTGTAWTDRPGVYKWLNINWVVHPDVPGVGTSAEKCFMFHKNSIGHAFNSDGMQMVVDYNSEDDYSFARCSFYTGAQLIQNSGVVVMNHDGSALAAA